MGSALKGIWHAGGYMLLSRGEKPSHCTHESPNVVSGWNRFKICYNQGQGYAPSPMNHFELRTQYHHCFGNRAHGPRGACGITIQTGWRFAAGEGRQQSTGHKTSPENNTRYAARRFLPTGIVSQARPAVSSATTHKIPPQIKP